MRRLSVLTFVAVVVILAVGSIGQAADEEVLLSISKPANGSFFAVGESPLISVVLPGQHNRDDYSQLRLHVYGPQETTQTKTAVKLLNASTDRSAKPHHYIDLITDTNVEINGNMLTYNMQAVSDEKPGTYTAALWVVLKDSTIQSFPLADFQIGTDTVELQIVEREKCGVCHLGADSGQYYFHHVDPGSVGSFGYPSIDSWAVRTCKGCHNTDGYAAYRDPGDPNVRIADPIVKRVHGIHMGEGLENPRDIDPVTGIFSDYIDVVFPYGVRGETTAPYEEISGVRNCTVCHVDDRWKTEPSRLACGACHDNIWFGSAAEMPQTAEAHPGGQQVNDSGCSFCHPADGSWTEGTVPAPISTVHKVDPHPTNVIELSMTLPLNGEFYTADDDVSGVTVTITIKDDAGNPIDHTSVSDTNFSAANFFVYGPRDHTEPVLTNAAINQLSEKRASVTNSTAASGDPKGWDFVGTEEFKISINGGDPFTVTSPAGHQTPDDVVAWLNAAFAANSADAIATKSGSTKVNIKTLVQNWQGSRIDIYNSAVTTIMGWKASGVTMEPYVNVGRSSTSGNDLRDLTKVDPALDFIDPDVTRNAENITYNLPGKFANLTPGTYFVYSYCVPSANKVMNFTNPVGLGLITFQVGTATEEEKVATNCTDCHGDSIMHLYESHIHPGLFDPDYCKACHDYSHYNTGDAFVNQGGTSTNGWSGFGAVPISRRVHGVHFGKYLNHSEEIYANADYFKDVIFPQDVRNCTKCHADNPMWKEEAARVPCLACHDSDEAKYHGQLMTFFMTPDDPYSGDEVETCVICHGSHADFSPDKMHNISDPYKPPYPREPEEE
jgi:hypothetical protein